MNNPYMNLPGISAEELGFLQQATAGLDEEQLKYFFNIYADRRKSPQDMLMFCVISIFIPGVQRFIMGETTMAVLYFFTGGFFFVMTIMDLINYRKLSLELNQKIAYETLQIIKIGSAA